MNEKLQKVLLEVRSQMESTVISFPQRDPDGIVWGSPRYNGNCSGKVPLGFIDKLGAKTVGEVYAGSGTLSDVCRDFGLPYIGVDLNPNPVRKNIISMDVTDMENDYPDQMSQVDMVFLHPPYPGIRHIQYAGKEWEDPSGYYSTRDIQNMNFDRGMNSINKALIKTYQTIRQGAFMVILVGDIRSAGKFYSMAHNLVLPGELFQTYVKMQHNTSSGRGTYGKNQRALTAQEHILVLKKPSGYEFALLVPKKLKTDIRKMVSVTWKELLFSVMENLKEAPLQKIYSEISVSPKIQKNPNWQAKVRQTLQQSELFRSDERGVWRIA